MLEKLIKERMQLGGWTQSKLAEMIGCTPTQLGLFLKSQASLNREALDKCLQVVGINVGIGIKRIEIAKLAAQRLENLSIKEISYMSKHTMARKTGIDAIDCLPDPTEKEFERMIESGIVDYEGTFPFFKSLVLHFHNIKDQNITPKVVQSSFENIAKTITLIPLASLPLLGFVPSLMGFAIGALLSHNIYSKVAQNAWAPFLTITKGLFNKI